MIFFCSPPDLRSLTLGSPDIDVSLLMTALNSPSPEREPPCPSVNAKVILLDGAWVDDADRLHHGPCDRATWLLGSRPAPELIQRASLDDLCSLTACPFCVPERYRSPAMRSRLPSPDADASRWVSPSQAISIQSLNETMATNHRDSLILFSYIANLLKERMPVPSSSSSSCSHHSPCCPMSPRDNPGPLLS